MGDMKQINLDFEDIKDEYVKHWNDMPEFNQPNDEAYQSVKINFRTKQDVDAFMLLIKQRFTERTKSIWHPEYDREKPSLFSYANEE